MTTGEKIKEARRRCGLSQEQLAEKLAVSRSAVAKWETDHGLPDVENLRALASLLQVSIDELLNDAESIRTDVIRETYTLSDYGKGSKKAKKDRVMAEKFPHAKIHTLLGELKLKKSERIIDNLLGFFTDAPFGTADLFNSLKNLDQEFYLAEQDGTQYLVTVTDEFVETRRLAERVTSDRFELGDWRFVKCKYEVKK